MRLVLTGGTGFIGSALRRSLTEKGHEVVILTRQVSRENQPVLRTRFVYWNPPEPGPWQRELEGVEAVINLAGESLVGRRWTEKQKARIQESRIFATRAIVESLGTAKRKPALLLNASAIGYYGPHGDEGIDETHSAGKDFLGRTCQAWEAEALRAEGFGIRVIRVRIGIVLEKEGGALQKMLPPFQLGIGGPLGSGRQWMSWIQLDDLVGLIHFLLEKKEAKGIFNATAPNPVQMEEFAQTLGRVLRRPAVFPVPEFALKILLGEMAQVLLTGQRVLPKRALELGYSFRYPRLEGALKAIFEK